MLSVFPDKSDKGFIFLDLLTEPAFDFSIFMVSESIYFFTDFLSDLSDFPFLLTFWFYLLFLSCFLKLKAEVIIWKPFYFLMQTF